jgi:hypothetical protein
MVEQCNAYVGKRMLSVFGDGFDPQEGEAIRETVEQCDPPKRKCQFDTEVYVSSRNAIKDLNDAYRSARNNNNNNNNNSNNNQNPHPMPSKSCLRRSPPVPSVPTSPSSSTLSLRQVLEGKHTTIPLNPLNIAETRPNLKERKKQLRVPKWHLEEDNRANTSWRTLAMETFQIWQVAEGLRDYGEPKSILKKAAP